MSEKSARDAKGRIFSKGTIHQDLVYLGMNFYKVHYNQNESNKTVNQFHEIFSAALSLMFWGD